MTITYRGMGWNGENGKGERHPEGAWDEPDTEAEASAGMEAGTRPETSDTEDIKRVLTPEEERDQLAAIWEEEAAREVVDDGEEPPIEAYDADDDDDYEIREFLKAPEDRKPRESAEEILDRAAMPMDGPEEPETPTNPGINSHLPREYPKGTITPMSERDRSEAEEPRQEEASASERETTMPDLLDAAARERGSADRTRCRSRKMQDEDGNPDISASRKKRKRERLAMLIEERRAVIEGEKSMPIDGSVLPPRMRFVERIFTRNFLPVRDTLKTDFPFAVGDPKARLPMPYKHKISWKNGSGEYLTLDPKWLPVADGNATLYHTWLGFPHGKWGRLTLFYAISEAYRTGSRQVGLFGGSADRFLTAMGRERGGSETGANSLLLDAFARWACNDLSFVRTRPGMAEPAKMSLFEDVGVGVETDGRNRRRIILPESITLSEQLMQSPWDAFAPVDLDAVNAMHGSTAMDALIYFSTLLPNLMPDEKGGGTFMTWHEVRDRFFSNKTRPTRVKERFRPVIQQIWEVWPDTIFTLHFCEGGLEAHRTAPMIPRKKDVTRARKRAHEGVRRAAQNRLL